MGFKVVYVLVSAVVIQTISGQHLRAPIVFANEIAATNLPAEIPFVYPTPGPMAFEASPMPFEAARCPGVPGLNYGLSLAELSSSNGGGLRVNSVSPIASTGVTVETDKMVIEGPLAVAGQLPFLGAVALDGPLPATGTGAVTYECGNGQVGMLNEVSTPAPAYPSGPLGPAYPNGPYPNMPFASGYPNPGLGNFANGIAPGYGPMPRA